MNTLTDLLRDYLDRASQGDRDAWYVFRTYMVYSYRKHESLTAAIRGEWK